MNDQATQVAAVAALSGLDIPAQYRQSVARQLVALQEQAQLVLDLRLAESTEPAPVFLP